VVTQPGRDRVPKPIPVAVDQFGQIKRLPRQATDIGGAIRAGKEIGHTVVIPVRTGQASRAVAVGRRTANQRFLGLRHRGGRRLVNLPAQTGGTALTQGPGRGREKDEEHEYQQCHSTLAG
jgi:hypothetical protein